MSITQTQPNTQTSDTAEPTAVVYLRVSTQRQVNKAHDPEGYSIPAQREACQRYAASLGARIIEEYVEPGRTGTNTRRPALQQLLAELPDLAPTYAIFYDLSRVARDDFDALWLLREIESGGSKLESTVERVDDTPAGKLLYTVMAGVNAFRSRGDAEKVKLGHQRKHADGGSIGPAKLGYLNVSENVAGRVIASIAIDPERSSLVQLAFDSFATGNYTITTLTSLLERAGLTTRATPTRPSRPLSRSRVHRMLRDDYYLGVVTLKGVKNVHGRHEALIDRATFDRVQELLDAHRISGDRSQKHHHYLGGSIFCGVCGKRLGFGRHRSKTGAYYEYFSCLSRLSRHGRCAARYFPVDATEQAVATFYESVVLTASGQKAIRQAVREYADAKAETSRTESKRHNRRLDDLRVEQQKLIQLYYRELVSEEVLAAEQKRIETERAEANRWAEAADREVENIMEALDEALVLIGQGRYAYRVATSRQRRLINQALYERLLIEDGENIEAELSPLYAALLPLARQSVPATHRAVSPALGRSPRGRRRGSHSTNKPDPVSTGPGSHVEQMAGGPGLEPG